MLWKPVLVNVETHQGLRSTNPSSFLTLFACLVLSHSFPLFTCASEMSSYTFPMHSTKYILWQDENGWRGYLEAYPEHEAHGESFEDLQIKLWQLHQDLTGQERERDQYQHPNREHGQYGNGECDRHHNHTSTLSRHTPTMSRPMSRAQIKRRARVEQLLFAMISNR
jgi:hypothetical protein